MNNRLSKVLAAAGVASRRAAEEIILAGRVKVNGKVVLVPQTHVTLGTDRIEVDGCQVGKAQKKYYFLLNKPAGYVCSTVSKNSPTVYDLFGGVSERLFTVGRLDKETEGLIIVTNDGHFAQRVIHPSFNIDKEYLAKTSQEITDEHLKELSRGGIVEGCFVKPVAVSKVRRGTLKVTVREGKKREVRELLAQAGLNVLELKRIRIGPLVLGGLQPGQWRELREKEINQFYGEDNDE